jgi:hypothetical protein
MVKVALPYDVTLCTLALQAQRDAEAISRSAP